MATSKDEKQPSLPPDTPEEKYREALSIATTKAANLLGELI